MIIKKKKPNLRAPDLTLLPEHSREWRSILVAEETFVGLRLIVIYQIVLEWFGLAYEGQRGYRVLFVN